MCKQWFICGEFDVWEAQGVNDRVVFVKSIVTGSRFSVTHKDMASLWEWGGAIFTACPVYAEAMAVLAESVVAEMEAA